MSLNSYNKLRTAGRYSIKDTNDVQILNLVGVAQNLADDSKNSSEKSNRGSTKGEPDYTRDLPTCMLEQPKGGLKKTRAKNNIGGARNTNL